MNENHDDKGLFASGGAGSTGTSKLTQGRLAQAKANAEKARGERAKSDKAKATKEKAAKTRADKKTMASATNANDMKAAHESMDKNSLAAHEHVAVDAHHQTLTAAGNDKAKFDSALKGMKLNKAQATVLAHKYTHSVTKYKTIKAAKEDISKGFVRNARFANKIA